MRLDVCIIELGGTVGDIESAAFIESMRQLRMKAGNKENFVSASMYSLAASTEFIKAAHTCHIYPSDSWRTENKAHAAGDPRCTQGGFIP